MVFNCCQSMSINRVTLTDHLLFLRLFPLHPNCSSCTFLPLGNNSAFARSVGYLVIGDQQSEATWADRHHQPINAHHGEHGQLIAGQIGPLMTTKRQQTEGSNRTWPNRKESFLPSSFTDCCWLLICLSGWTVYFLSLPQARLKYWRVEKLQRRKGTLWTVYLPHHRPSPNNTNVRCSVEKRTLLTCISLSSDCDWHYEKLSLP